MKQHGVLAFLALTFLFLQTAGAQPLIYEDRRLDAITSSRLGTFRSEQDFQDYFWAVRQAAIRRGFAWTGYGRSMGDVVILESTAQLELSHGYAAAQEAGVDEADIVKQVGRFLIVLRDGRLFSIDTRPDGGPGLKLADRADVYDPASARRSYGNPAVDTWYPEMLAQGDRIVVAGYNYMDGRQVSVFTINAAGAFVPERSYFLPAYYSFLMLRYQMRLVGDALIFYASYDLQQIDPREGFPWPRSRRAAVGDRGERLYDARDVYKPLLRTLMPALHAVSICPLSSERGVECVSTPIIGPDAAQFYVTPSHAYLWVAATDEERTSRRDQDIEACAPGAAATFEDAEPAVLYRIPLRGGAPSAMRTRGWPLSSYAMDASQDEFRGLVVWGSMRCNGPTAFKYFRAPLTAFTPKPAEIPAQNYIDAPDNGAGVAYFTDDYLIYGERVDWEFNPQAAHDATQTARLVAIPLAHPRDAVLIQAPHNITALERAGDAIVLRGYRGDGAGLSVSHIDLRSAPRISATAFLSGRYDGYGFDSLIGAGGAGVMGLRSAERSAWTRHAGGPDVSFFALNAGELASLGVLGGGATAAHPSYRCEVSCNEGHAAARPIFADGRVFVLSGVDMIEGAIADGAIREVRHLNLTSPPQTGAD